MQRSYRYGLAACLTVAVAGISAWAESASEGSSKPCEAPEYRQFDFWVGEWDLRSRLLTDPENGVWEESSARNSVRLEYDGCVIREQFEGAPATVLRGTSVSVYNPGKELWQQTWVDNGGGYMTFEGGLDDSGRMILAREVHRGENRIHQRMVFANITRDSLDWYWERSTDLGVTWNLLWHLHYTRRP